MIRLAYIAVFGNTMMRVEIGNRSRAVWPQPRASNVKHTAWTKRKQRKATVNNEIDFNDVTA